MAIVILGITHASPEESSIGALLSAHYNPYLLVLLRFRQKLNSRL